MFFLGAVFTFALLMVTIPPSGGVDSSYVAAVYEHNLILNPDPRVPLSRREALRHLQKNLDIYEDQAARAAQQVPTGALSYIATVANFLTSAFKHGFVYSFVNPRLCLVVSTYSCANVALY